MNHDLATALRLQALDQRIVELKKEIATLPTQISRIEKALEGHTKRLELDKAALAGNQRERKKLDGEIAGHQQKISKLREQMLGAKNNEQYRAFQSEITWGEAEIQRSEDRILEMMTEAEALESKVRTSEAALGAERAQVEAQKTEARGRIETVKAELKTLETERATAAQTIPAKLLATYERLRKRMRDGQAIAEVKEGTCSACNMTLRPQFYAEVRQAEDIMLCESCRRILYYQAPAQDVAEQMNV